MDCHSGDTFTDGGCRFDHDLDSRPQRGHLAHDQRAVEFANNLSKAPMPKRTQPRFMSDPETHETIISGMGEPLGSVPRAYASRVQGAGGVLSTARRLPRDHHAARRVQLHAQEADRWFGSVRSSPDLWSRLRKASTSRRQDRRWCHPSRVHRSCDKGFKSRWTRVACGQPVIGIKVTINDGSSHVDLGHWYQEAARGAWRGLPKAGPVILEPIMKVEARVLQSSPAR